VTAYVAPAAKVFTEAHIITGPAVKPGQLTRCGTEMDPADVWVPVVLEPGDRVCKGCQGLPEDEQAVLL
jgi:hypothetical protein